MKRIFSWGNERRFNSFTSFCKAEFGSRLQKISIDAGLSCPNRDPQSRKGGCAFCNNDAFSPSYCRPSMGITNQIDAGIEFHKWRYRKATKYLAYFQSYTNTYSDLLTLRKMYEEALKHPEIDGLAIGTRPDCINETILEMLRNFSEKNFIMLEFGIESCKNATLEFCNRGHRFEDTVEALLLAEKKGIFSGGHVILGLPGESRNDMLNTAATLSQLPLRTLKIHQLQILKGSRFESDYAKTPEKFQLFDLDNYIAFIIEFLERLSPRIMIERLSAEVPPKFLAGPCWGNIRGDEILRRIEADMEKRDTWQGKRFLKR